MKLKPKAEILPENIFVLREDALPTTGDIDPWGKIMVLEKMLVGLSFNKLMLYSF